MSIIQLKAHDINTASITLSPLNGVWTVHFSFAQAGVDYSLSKYLGNNSLDTLNADSYKEYLADYIKSHFSLVIDNKSIPLGSGGIKLGNHQTDIRFLIPEFPEKYEHLFLHIPLFEEKINQHNMVRINEGENTVRMVLKHTNNFEWELIHDRDRLREKKKSNFSNAVSIGIGVLAGAILMGLVIRKIYSFS